MFPCSWWVEQCIYIHMVPRKLFARCWVLIEALRVFLTKPNLLHTFKFYGWTFSPMGLPWEISLLPHSAFQTLLKPVTFPCCSHILTRSRISVSSENKAFRQPQNLGFPVLVFCLPGPWSHTCKFKNLHILCILFDICSDMIYFWFLISWPSSLVLVTYLIKTA